MDFLSRIGVLRKTAFLMRSQWWPRSRIEAYQQSRLREILRHAVDCVPHYRALGVADEPDEPHRWLSAFPVLTKAQLQSIGPDLHAECRYPEPLYTSRTSGSTGEPTTTRFDNDTWLTCKYALKARRVLNAGSPLGQRVLVVAERADAADRAFDAASWKGRLFSARNLFIEDEVAQNVARLTAFRPTILYGFPSYLEYLAEQSQAHTERVPRVPVLFTSSEVLSDTARSRLEAAFAGRVTDVYGSTEFKEIAVECEYRRYHINFESVYVESAPDPLSGAPRLLVTTLLNTAMPLIRYDLGDHASLDDSPCDCGRKGPTLGQPEGRKSEMLLFPDGTAITSYELTTAIGSFPEIKNFAIVQRDADRVDLSVYADPVLQGERRALLLRTVGALLPPDVTLALKPLARRLPQSKRVAVRREFDADPAPREPADD